MKKIIRIFAWSLLVISCSKEQEQVQLVQEAQTQPDIIQLLVDNPNHFTEENWTGMDGLMDDLQLTEEQRQKCYEEEEIMMQLFPKSNSQAKKRVVLKSIGVQDEDDILFEDYFSSLSGLMTEYSSFKGVSEQWSQIFDDVIMAVGSLSEKMVEASVVVDLSNLVKEDLKKCNSDINTKYLLTEDETLQVNKMLNDMQRVLTGESFLVNVQNAKIGGSSGNALTKGFFDIFHTVGKILLTITTVALTTTAGFIIGYAGGLTTLNPATAMGGGGGVVGAAGGLALGIKHVYEYLWKEKR